VSEALSEKFSEKLQRGRPRVVDPSTEAVYEGMGLYDGKYSQRARVNTYYRQRALSCLMVFDDPDADAFKWLADLKASNEGKIKPWRETILSELGRIKDEGAMRAVALRICELKPQTKEAVDIICRWRLGGKSKPGDIESLRGELCRCIDDYKRRHPDTQLSQIKDALNDAYYAVEILEREALK
jgi:hypothetical protein